jgi:hypothetical protein
MNYEKKYSREQEIKELTERLTKIDSRRKKIEKFSTVMTVLLYGVVAYAFLPDFVPNPEVKSYVKNNIQQITETEQKYLGTNYKFDFIIGNDTVKSGSENAIQVQVDLTSIPLFTKGSYNFRTPDGKRTRNLTIENSQTTIVPEDSGKIIDKILYSFYVKQTLTHELAHMIHWEISDEYKTITFQRVMGAKNASDFSELELQNIRFVSEGFACHMEHKFGGTPEKTILKRSSEYSKGYRRVEPYIDEQGCAGLIYLLNNPGAINNDLRRE